MVVKIAVYGFDYTQSGPGQSTTYQMLMGTTNPVSPKEFRLMAEEMISQIPDNLPPEQLNASILKAFEEKGFFLADYFIWSGIDRNFKLPRKELSDIV